MNNDEIPRELATVNGKTVMEHWIEFREKFYASDRSEMDLNDYCRECYLEGAKLLQELLPLARFGSSVFELHRRSVGDDFDGSDLQEIAEEHGLISLTIAKERCGDYCNCAEVGSFPQCCYISTSAARVLDNPQEKVDGDSND